MMSDDLQRSSRHFVFTLNRHIEVIHCPKSYSPQNPFPGQDIIQQFQGVGLYLNISKILYPITLRSRITINTLMLTSPVEVHVVL